MKIFDAFKKIIKKKEKPATTSDISTGLPEDLERFRVRRGPEPVPEPAPVIAPEPMPPRPELPRVGPPAPVSKENLDKDDMILQKLETIDARLRLIEEKLK